MCGLAGVLLRNGADNGTPASLATIMSDTLTHRGPDDSSVWTDAAAGVAFGFRRLAILDLSEAGRQPMRSASGRYVLMFNGEVYNHQPLRQELLDRGHRFRGHSDTEVILAAVEEWGVRSAVERFVGMFGIAIWDATSRRLILVRDRLGIKPLYVWRHGSVVAFASELKAIAALPGFEKRIDVAAVADYLRYLYVPGPRTIFESVVKLPPGHLLEVEDPSQPLPASEPYWSVEQAARLGSADPFPGDEREAIQTVDRLLSDAVGIRMVADVPVGALLSGGIDSSTVVALMQRVSSRPVRTYTVGFDGSSDYDEAVHAAAVARALGTDHTELRVGPHDAMTLVPDMPTTFDEPIADPSLLPTYLVCRLARRDVTVALTGDGGDEVFAGYNRYVYGARMLNAVGLIPSGVRRALRPICDSIGSDAAPVRSWRGRLGKVGRLVAAGSRAEMYRALHEAWRDPAVVVPTALDEPGPFVAALSSSEPSDLLGRMQMADQQVYLPDDLLAKVDRASMAVSLEARVPILDHRVVEFAWRLAPNLKVRGNRGKWILRQVLYSYVPQHLVERPKMGFTVPVEAWLRGPMRAWGDDLMGGGLLERTGLLDAPAARDAWQSFQRGRGHSGLALWALLVLLSWWSHWVD
ncbi:MAG: asparagine synthase (glutamine-hydrolyzing) [Gemmatimonadales bacterium]